MKSFLQKLTSFVSILVLLSVQQAGAITQNDVDCTLAGGLSGTCYYDPCFNEDGATTAAPTTEVEDSGPAVGGPIYIMGDSITELAKNTYVDKFKKGGWGPAVNGLVSRHIASEPPSPSGLGQIENDKTNNELVNAKAIVIGLGTNDSGGSPASIRNNVNTVMAKLKKYNKTDAPIFWVNIINTQHDADSQKTNRAIKDAVGKDGEVIDWYGAAKDSADLGSFDLGVHPTKQKDIDLLVDLVYKQVNEGASKVASASETTAECCPTDGGGETAAGVSDDKVVQFLQALSFQENGGQVTGTSSSDAQGKFQYIYKTWHSHAQIYYPPADKYATANEAPEEVQDALAYIEYTAKFKEFHGDVFKIAVSHFYPVANTDPAVLDQQAPGNVITPRQYADSVIRHMKKGDGKNIKFKHADAPEFDKYLAKAGGAAEGGSVNDSSSGATCGCPVNGGGGDTVVLDPGHSPSTDPNGRDSKTGLYNQDYANQPEMDNAFKAAEKIENKLKKKGYKVVITKKSADDTLNLSERARRANETKGALLFTMHSDPASPNVLMYPDKNSVRTPGGGVRKDGTNGLVHPDIASKSEDLAKKMAPVIAKGIGAGSYKAISFADFYGAAGIQGNGKNNGNTPVQTILSSIPEVYSEVGPDVLPSDAFADAATDAVVKALGDPGGGGGVSAFDPGGDSSCAPAGSADAAADLAMQEYAWPDGSHGLTPRGAYAAAISSHPKEYKGGCNGADCGAFVTRVMRDSGADKNYNKKESYTLEQKKYMDDHPELYENLGSKTSTKDLRPGDIAITAETHTYMYVGPQSDHPNFKGDAASASHCERMPNASNTYFTDVNGVPFTWYRLKGGS